MNNDTEKGFFMKNIVKKILSIVLFLSASSPTSYTDSPKNSWAAGLHKESKFSLAQNKYIYTKKSYTNRFIKGYKGLDKEKFNIIMQSDTWDIVFNKIKNEEKCTRTNRDRFKYFLAEHACFSEETINFLSYPLSNNHLCITLQSMWQFGYSFEEINQFKHFLIALFAPHLYEDIKLFEQNIKNSAKQQVYDYLIRGFRPDWVISLDDDLYTGLMIAVNANNYDIVSMLIECPKIYLNAVNSQGMNALMMSIKNKNESIAQVLLKKKGWDFWNFNTNRETAIALASIYLPELEDVIAKQFKPYLEFQ